jgi:uncharacterized protein
MACCLTRTRMPARVLDKGMPLLVAEIVWPGPDIDPSEVIAERLGISMGEVSEWQMLRRSVDGRRRPPRWLANYRVVLKEDEALVLARKIHGVRPFTDRDNSRFSLDDPPSDPRPSWPGSVRPIVVGAGPAGMFAALRLAEAGAPALLLERGQGVEKRHYAVRDFWRHGTLDENSNVVFGEGGAGAFSDGKIYTRRRDGDLGWIFRRLVAAGADRDILAEGYAHLGTDKIREILPRLRQRMMDLGVEIRFDARVDSLMVQDDVVTGVRLAGGTEIVGAPVIVATGHSARDSWNWMLDAGATAEPRPIHIGARVEHPQRLIDRARYGAERGEFPPASYRLRSNPSDGRSAHTFCMCPGGTVVPASNHSERVVVNGMSYSRRQAFHANSAIIVSVEVEDYDGTDPLAGVRFQDAIEARAYAAGGGSFAAPAQRVEDFLNDRPSTELPKNSYILGTKPADLRDVLPPFIVEGMKTAIRHFEGRVKGFAGPDGVIIAPETRTTAPLRFHRDEFMTSTTLPNLMPIGEGAGYAGGIISAALEGYRAAQVLVDRYCPVNDSLSEHR